MEKIKQDLLTYFYKWWVIFLYILIGLVGKFSYDMIKGRKITLWQALSSAGMALFVGFIASAICFYNNWERPQMIIVPCATLLSEKLIIALFNVNYNKIISDILKYWSDQAKGK